MTDARDTSKDDEKDLPTLVGELTLAVTALADAHRRKRLSDAVVAALVVVLGACVLLYYFVELPDRRDAINDKIRDLACSAVAQRPPGFSITYDKIRDNYDCPPYNPAQTPDVNTPSAVPSTSVVPGPTVTRTPPAGPTVTRTPSPAATRSATTTRTATATVTAPGPTRTRTVVRAAPTVTVTATCVIRIVIGVVCP